MRKMLKPKALTQVLTQANTGGVISTLYVYNGLTVIAMERYSVGDIRVRQCKRQWIVF